MSMSVQDQNDIDRVRSAYAKREQRYGGTGLYSRSNPGELHRVQTCERVLLKLLAREGALPLRCLKVLDLGCANGGLLLQLMADGATPDLLHGVDLLEDRIEEARARLPHLHFMCNDAQDLPYEDGTFDLVFQYMLFSSVLDDEVRQRIAREMMRVVRRPHGLIVWYDFWLNPKEKQSRGLSRAGVRALFPGCTYAFRSVSLAPPLCRRLAPHSWLACDALQAIRILNTHTLGVIRPPGVDSASE
jgi:SAM-dependent methyltransferase